MGVQTYQINEREIEFNPNLDYFRIFPRGGLPTIVDMPFEELLSMCQDGSIDPSEIMGYMFNLSYLYEKAPFQREKARMKSRGIRGVRIDDLSVRLFESRGNFYFQGMENTGRLASDFVREVYGLKVEHRENG